MKNQFRSAVNQFPVIFILGDFNIPYISNNTCCNLKWSTFYSKYSLTQLITEPTRLTQNTSSIIDHIYTTYLDRVSDIVVPKVAISDHFPVGITQCVNQCNFDKKYRNI